MHGSQESNVQGHSHTAFDIVKAFAMISILTPKTEYTRRFSELPTALYHVQSDPKHATN
jgi:hypothetical protein